MPLLYPNNISARELFRKRYFVLVDILEVSMPRPLEDAPVKTKLFYFLFVLLLSPVNSQESYQTFDRFWSLVEDKL